MFNTKAIRRIEAKANKIDRKQEALQKNIELLLGHVDERLDAIEKKIDLLLQERYMAKADDRTEPAPSVDMATADGKGELSYKDVMDEWLNGRRKEDK